MFRVACLAATLLSSAPSRGDDAKAPAELQGCWKLTSVEAVGKSSDPVGGGEPRWVVKGNKIQYGGVEIAKFAADPTATPRVIDITFSSPEREYEGVYAIEKDTLKVCLNARAGAKDRPSGFDTKDQAEWRLLVFEREKAAPAVATEGLTGYVGIQLRGDPATKEVIVDAPLKDSPADKAGLKKEDVVLRVGGSAVADLNGTVEAVRKSKPGDKLVVKVRRGGKEVDVTVAVGVFPFPWAVGLE